MTFQQLREFCMIAEYENMTMAAKALFITQPALSMALKNTEAEIGTALFERRGKNIYINKNGEEFYDYAKRTLSELDALISRFAMPAAGDKILRFCYTSAYISEYLLPSFSASNPNISITINDVEENLIQHFLETEIYDIAITSHPHNTSKGCNIISEKFFQNRLVASVPVSNCLSSRSSLSLKDLDGQKFFRLSKQGEFSEVLDAMAKKEGIYMSVAQRVNYEVIKMLQRNFDFLYFITTLQAEFDYLPVNRKLIPVEGEMFSKTMYISYLEKNREQIRPFTDWVENRLINRTGGYCEEMPEK